ncbi:hypothetical protein WCX49_04875 [Sulfurimonas sp. HSL-1656]|uniref:hypothetical protein n=1 Tax=Thiomicrolovo subterrani TaxID=3131934 RepID=UPI0031F900F0
MTDFTSRVFVPALMVGAVLFAISIFIPGGLGIVLGLFVTGPIGFFSTALWKLYSVSIKEDKIDFHAALKWFVYVFIWISLYILLLMNGFSMFVLFIAALLQLFAVLLSMTILDLAATRSEIPKSLRRTMSVIIAAMALIMFTTLLPPVKRPIYGPASTLEMEGPDTILPKVAFILDSDLDASRQYPMLVIDRNTLAMEWLIITAAALGLNLVLIGIRRRSRGEDDISGTA